MGYNPRPQLTSAGGTTAFPLLPRTTLAAPTNRVLGGGSLLNGRTDVTDETLFLSNLPVIDEVVGHVCRRHRLSGVEAEDFAQDVRLHFIERNYERLRRFEGRSSLRTYITVVVHRCFLDYRNKLWGKWRPSAEATRLGPIGILLERMVARDGFTVDHAIEMIETNHGIAINNDFAALRERLAQRQPMRQRLCDEEADRLESPAPPSDVNVVRAEQDFVARRVRAACARACQALGAEERLILRMRYDDVPVADIARTLHLNQKRLYRTIERLLADLRARLESEGISKDEVRMLFASGALGGPDAPDEPAIAAGRGLPR